MPYGIRKSKGKFITYNKDTGQVKGTHSSLRKAEAQRRLLEAIKHGGWKPTGKKSKLKKSVVFAVWRKLATSSKKGG